MFNEFGKGREAQQKRKADEELNVGIPKQPKISSHFEGSSIMKLCVGLVVNRGRPFKLFDDLEMKTLLAKAQMNEKIEIYPEKVKDAVKAAAEKKRAEVRKLLVGNVLSFSLDMATCRHRSFIGKIKIAMIKFKITFRVLFLLQGLNAQLFMNGAIRVINLLCREVTERHLAVNIQKWIKDGQHEYEIIDQQILSLAIDSARNMTRAADDFIGNLSKEATQSDEDVKVDIELQMDEELSPFSDDPLKEIEELDGKDQSDEDEEITDEPCDVLESAFRIHCVAHKLQLAVNDFLWKNHLNKRLILKAQKLAAKLRNSIVRSLISDAKLNQAVLDQKTRWNSTYLMIVRLLGLKDFCESKSPPFKGLNIPERTWKNLQEMQDVLKPVAELTSRLQHEQLDVSQFVAYWKLAVFKISSQGSQKAAELMKCVELREKPIFANRLVQCAIYLDKRFNFILSNEETVASKTFVMQIWRKKRALAGENDDESDEEPEACNTENDTDTEMNQFGAFLNNLAQAQASVMSSQATAMKRNPSVIEAELAAFEAAPRLSPDVQILDFWKNGKSFPVLRNIAFDILSVPMTEVSVERLFSHLNFIMNPHRSTLSCDVVEDILFLRMNNQFEGKN